MLQWILFILKKFLQLAFSMELAIRRREEKIEFVGAGLVISKNEVNPFVQVVSHVIRRLVLPHD